MELNSFPSSSSSSSSSSSNDEMIYNPLTNPLLATASFPSLDMNLISSMVFLEDGESSSRQQSGKKRIEKWRGRAEGDQRLYFDYFAPILVYNEKDFRRRFRMHKHLFLKIVDELTKHDSYFVQKYDAVNRKGFSSIQKCTAGIRMLAYDVAADAIDEYLRMGESTALQCMKKFCRAIVKIFGEEYLRKPNSEDVARLNVENAARGFPGMLGSVDCMHWKWKNCPTALHGQYQSGHQKGPTIILQAVASKNLWIWDTFFGVSGCNNDINVLEKSDLFFNFAKGEAPPCHFEVNGNEYNMGYYLADGIYPPWACFVKSVSQPLSVKDRNFAGYQEGARKDVERAFGVLQARWHIIKGSARLWDESDLNYIMTACIILHNMIVEDETPQQLIDLNFPAANSNSPPPPVERVLTEAEEFNAFIERRVGIRNREIHTCLQTDLIQHIWEFHGARN